MICVIDFGLGNVRAFLNAYKRLGIDAIRATDSSHLDGASKLILPGVGSYDRAMEGLNNSGMRSTLESLVLNKNVPLLGICVGMQILSLSSDEGRLPGLGWVRGKVISFGSKEDSVNLPRPHMGWNSVMPRGSSALFQGIPEKSKFYFLHSFLFRCDDVTNILATTEYGGNFSSAVFAKNVYGVQFHPEKSHNVGLQLLKNFANI
jgi:glutamine amidotransferase